MNLSEMPSMRPLPIPTRDQPLGKRVWRWITAIRKWILVDDWEYQLPDGQPLIVVPKGFIFDGASIPRPLWGLLSPTGLLLVPGLIHDFAYRYDYLWAVHNEGYVYKYREGAGRKTWDALFHRVGLHVNGMAIIDMLAWLALAGLGSLAWRANRRRREPEIKPERPVRSDR